MGGRGAANCYRQAGIAGLRPEESGGDLGGRAGAALQEQMKGGTIGWPGDELRLQTERCPAGVKGQHFTWGNITALHAEPGAREALDDRTDLPTGICGEEGT